ncbi:MAG: hypothetical protein ACXAEN_24275 [Candidatus Thorarchaeota archaeon]|jgi:hypothetical protein
MTLDKVPALYVNMHQFLKGEISYASIGEALTFDSVIPDDVVGDEGAVLAVVHKPTLDQLLKAAQLAAKLYMKALQKKDEDPAWAELKELLELP